MAGGWGNGKGQRGRTEQRGGVTGRVSERRSSRSWKGRREGEGGFSKAPNPRSPLGSKTMAVACAHCYFGGNERSRRRSYMLLQPSWQQTRGTCPQVALARAGQRRRENATQPKPRTRAPGAQALCLCKGQRGSPCDLRSLRIPPSSCWSSRLLRGPEEI